MPETILIGRHTVDESDLEDKWFIQGLEDADYEQGRDAEESYNEKEDDE